MSKIFIHCGLHKTGSTSLQLALCKHIEDLKSVGVLFPLSGRPYGFGGQHHIAWQLARDRRFSTVSGDIESLAAEMASHSGDVILTSEDFESSITHPDAVMKLVQCARAANKSLVFVVYVRNQNSYLDSLYRQNLKFLLGEEYSFYASEVLRFGKVYVREWEYLFDYWELSETLSAVPEINVIFRNYHTLIENSPIVDFCSVTDLDAAIFKDSVNLRENKRDGIDLSLATFYQNRVRRTLNDYEKSAISRLCSHGLAGFAAPPSATRLAIERKFLESNTKLCERYSLPSRGLVPTMADQQSATLNMGRVFSFETQVEIAGITSLLENKTFRDAADVEAEIAGHVHSWSQWLMEAEVLSL